MKFWIQLYAGPIAYSQVPVNGPVIYVIFTSEYIINLLKISKVPFKTIDGNRIDDTPVHEALREALANCLINADFYGVRAL